MADILQIVADLRAKHMPPAVRPYTGSPTPTERATEGQGPPAWLTSAPAAAPAKPGVGAGGAAPHAQPWRTNPQASAQPIPVDKTYLRDIDAHSGRVLIVAQPGWRALRYVKANFAAELANGIDGVHVRLMQSQGKVKKDDPNGPVIVASSDPKDAERVYKPDAKRDPNGVIASLHAAIAAAGSAKGTPATPGKAGP